MLLPRKLKLVFPFFCLLISLTKMFQGIELHQTKQKQNTVFMQFKREKLSGEKMKSLLAIGRL